MINLKPFCGVESETRPYLSNPWSIGEWTYASDGRIAIRVPRLPDVQENDKAPASIVTIFQSSDALAFRPFSISIPPEPPTRCGDCGGKGHGARCPECGGEGTHGCNCDHCDRECSECEGVGAVFDIDLDEASPVRVACERCRGSGLSPDGRRVHLPNQLVLQVEHLQRILALPGPIETAAEHGGEPAKYNRNVIEHPPQLFRGPGYVAAIMPVRSSKPNLGDVVLENAGEVAA